MTLKKISTGYTEHIFIIIRIQRTEHVLNESII